MALKVKRFKKWHYPPKMIQNGFEPQKSFKPRHCINSRRDFAQRKGVHVFT